MNEKRFFHKGDDFNTEHFFMLPKELFTSPDYISLSNEAKLLYSLMLGRIKLSAKNGWFDSENKAYIFFTIEEIMKLLHIGKDKSVKVISELDEKKGCGLIRRKRSQGGQPAVIYVKRVTVKCNADNDSEVSNSDEKAEKTEVCNSENQKSGVLKNRSLDFGKTDSNNIEYNNIDMSNIYSILSYREPINKKPYQITNKIRDREIYKKIICENIGYDVLIKNHSKSDVDPLVNIMLDTVCSEKDAITICRDKIPVEVVKGRFLKLDMSHIEYVLESLKKTTTKIYNLKSYMLTSLYNSPDTMEQYYTNAVNHTFYG